MSVYVDYLGVHGNWRYGKSCHMTADTLDELHAMAERIGLQRSYFQPHPRFPHYDLNAGRREAAVCAGAVEQRRPVKAKA